MRGAYQMGLHRHVVRALALAVACTLVFAAGASALSVGNPPSKAKTGFTIAVRGAHGTVAVYLSPKRKLARGDVALGRVRIAHGKLKLKIARNVKAGSYYVILCTGKRRHLHCVASRRRTLVSATRIVAGEALAIGPPPTTDAAAAVSGAINSAQGGVITATGPEGTHFTLAYAPHAAQQGTQVTLTPITSLPGAPGKLLGGVEITPQSVLFARDTYIVITPRVAPSVREREGLTFEASGHGRHAIPIVPQSAPIVMPVARGAGYALMSGVNIAGAASIAHAASGSSEPGSGAYAGGYQSALAGLAQEAAAGGEDPGDPHSAYFKSVESLMKEWYADISGNLIPPGEQGDEAAETALQELFTWARTGATAVGDSRSNVGGQKLFSHEWAGMSDIFGANWEDAMVIQPAIKLVGKAYDRAQEQCANEHDLTKIEKVLSWARTDALLGHPEIALEQILACEHFTVKFDSKMTDIFSGGEGAPNGKWANDYTASVRVAPKVENTATFPLLGEAGGKYSETSGRTETITHKNNKECINESIEQSGAGATFNVDAMTVPNGVGAAGGGASITLNPGMPTEKVLTQATPSECDPFPLEVPEFSWFADWVAEHKPALISQQSFEYMFALTAGSGAEIGSIEFIDVPFSKGNATGKEDTTIKVMHSPASFNHL